MYMIGFTGILAFILILKSYKLWKNKRHGGDFQDVDDELALKLTEGDTIG